MLEEGVPLYSASFPDDKDVVLLDSDEEEISDNGKILINTSPLL